MHRVRRLHIQFRPGSTKIRAQTQSPRGSYFTIGDTEVVTGDMVKAEARKLRAEAVEELLGSLAAAR